MEGELSRPSGLPVESSAPDGRPPEGQTAVAPPQTFQDASKPAPSAAPSSGAALLLDRRRVATYRDEYIAELNPVGIVENAVVGDLARRAVAMERWGEAAEAVERHAARSLNAFDLPISDGADAHDAVLAGAMSSEAADRCERQALGHSRAFYRALQKLEELQARRLRGGQTGPSEPPPVFPDEAACEAYLAERFRRGRHRCPRCGATEGYYYSARRAWECAACKTQVGLRSGTVMAQSPLALRQWFEAIRWLLWRPTIGTAELAAQTGIRRPATVRTLARKVREAMAAENASEQLAGLDEYLARRERSP